MSDRCRVTSKPQRRIPIVPIAGVAAAAVLALGIHGRMTPAAGAHTTYAGTGGIENTELFDVAAEASFAPSLLFPSELVPSNPDWPQVSGAQKPSRSVMGELIEATRAIEDEGYEVGYALLDLDTGATVTYNADTAFYSASSIKGPYVTSVVEYELGDAVKSDASRISAILEYSDNAAYSTLRDAYGNTPFAKLVEATGAASLPSHGATDAVDAAAQIQSGASIADNKYEFFTPSTSPAAAPAQSGLRANSRSPRPRPFASRRARLAPRGPKPAGTRTRRAATAPPWTPVPCAPVTATSSSWS